MDVKKPEYLCTTCSALFTPEELAADQKMEYDAEQNIFHCFCFGDAHDSVIVSISAAAETMRDRLEE